VPNPKLASFRTATRAPTSNANQEGRSMADHDGDNNGLRALLARLLPARFRRAVVPVVRLSGTIGAVTPLRPGLSLSAVARTLERAFATKHAKAVALVINSPGGSPVQSRQIHARIRQLAGEKKLPVLV